ncbi:hypothetical protein [Actinocrispum wychmicini]|uniref:Uncharacterized protein n=1 Tax=Actinocrispum wychmicini TaxID=1213861 RepID=A0A4V2S8S2_9PSEU|nr:hypothetical protein [Actinocrispum wychmicini]TCO64940.1 hypothetical protein EV192_101724 [Actinocrispum wychmicini]
MDWDLVWGIFVSAATVGFGTLEITSLVTEHPGQGERATLSATLRKWLGIQPPAPRRWWARALFAGLLGWFGLHILTPWL